MGNKPGLGPSKLVDVPVLKFPALSLPRELGGGSEEKAMSCPYTSSNSKGFSFSDGDGDGDGEGTVWWSDEPRCP